MAKNPQADFDEDWDCSTDLHDKVASPIAGSSANFQWGVRKLLPSSGGTQMNQSVTERQLAFHGAGISRGRGIKNTNTGPSSIVPNSQQTDQDRFQQPQQASSRLLFNVPNSASDKTLFNVPDINSSKAKTDSRSTSFNFKQMASTLNTSVSVSASGDSSKPPSGTDFSFREAVSTAEKSRPNITSNHGTRQIQHDNNFEGDINIDGQANHLIMKMEKTSIPASFEHQRKVQALRQDPNHPLYSVTTFEHLDLKTALKSGLSADHKCKLSAIQEKTLPVLISPPYRNCIAQSQNGTGKTVTFVVTMLNRVDFSKPKVQAVCLLPTKELAQQVVETLQRLGRFFPNIQDMIFSAIRDSKPMLNSEGKLRTPIVVGTAGTVNGLMRKTKQLVFDDVILFVVDEADKMLEHQSEAFYITIENIVNRLSVQAQRVFFSATFSDSVVDLARKFMDGPLVIRLKDEELSLDNIQHFYFRVRSREEKLQAMKLIYNAMAVGQSIVFCRTRQMSHWLCTELRNQLDFKVAELSGDMEPRDRDEQISRFRRSADRVLVTTNLSARGLDILSVNLIINWDPPINYETKAADFDTYLHRVGRSGRFGADGIAVNMVEKEADMEIFRQIENHFCIKGEELSIHSYDHVERTLRKSDDLF